MIQNERQYKVTKGQIAKLERALAVSLKLTEKLDQRVYEAMIGGIQGEIEKLQQQLQEYESLRLAEILHLASVADLSQVLIQARVARGYTQKDLADKLHVKPQQVQKYEQTSYRSASLKRIIEIMNVLDIDFGADVRLKDGAASADRDVPEALSYQLTNEHFSVAGMTRLEAVDSRGWDDALPANRAASILEQAVVPGNKNWAA